MTDRTRSIIAFPSLETPAKRLANLFKQMVRENDRRDREAAHRRSQPKERDAVLQGSLATASGFGRAFAAASSGGVAADAVKSRT